MTKIPEARTLAFLVACLVALSACPAAYASDDWKLVSQKDGIDIYTRPSKDSANMESRGVVTVPHGVDAVLSVLENVDAYPSWYAHCKAAEVVERHPPDWRVVHMELDLPFPAGDRDAVVRIDREMQGKTRVLRISNDADAIPKVEGFVRMPRVEGSWQLEPQADGKSTRITLQQLNDPGGSLPTWLTNKLVSEQPATTLAGLRRVLDAR